MPPTATAKPAAPGRDSLLSANSGRAPSRSPRYRHVGLVVLIAGCVLAVLALVIGIAGRVSGREFAPSHFQVRSFSFFEIPVLRLQITPIKRHDSAPSLATYLQTSTLLNRPSAAPQAWHLVELSRGGISTAGEAMMLTAYLDSAGTATSGRWHQWTLNHPKLAGKLWPRVQRLARRNHYLLIPELFRQATTADEAAADQFDTQLCRYLADAYEQLIRDHRQAGYSVSAELLLQAAEQDLPHEARWETLR